MGIVEVSSLEHQTTSAFLKQSGVAAEGDSIAFRTIRDQHELGTLRSVWTSWPGSRESDPDFFSNMIQSRANGSLPHVIVLTRNARPDAILVGLCERRKIRFKLGSFTIFQPELNVLEFLPGGLRGNACEENCAALVREVMRSLNAGGIHLALWHRLDVQSTLYRCVLQLPFVSMRDNSPRLYDHWWLTQFPETLDAVLRSKGRNRRSKLRRKYHNALNQLLGKTRIRCFRFAAELETAISEMEEIASKSDKRRRFGVGFFDTPQSRHQMTFAAEKGWLRIYILYIEEKPVAFWMGTLYDRCLQGDHVGYDAAWRKLSPGLFLFLNILNDLRKEDIKAVDVGCGHTQLQRCFGDLRQIESTAHIYAPTIRGLGLNLLCTATHRATQWSRWLVKRYLGRTVNAWRSQLLPRSGSPTLSPLQTSLSQGDTDPEEENLLESP